MEFSEYLQRDTFLRHPVCAAREEGVTAEVAASHKDAKYAHIDDRYVFAANCG